MQKNVYLRVYETLFHAKHFEGNYSSIVSYTHKSVLKATNMVHYLIQKRLFEPSSNTRRHFTLPALYCLHYDDVIMTTMASQITSLTVVYSIVYSGIDQRKHQSSASLAFVRGIHRDR